MTTAEVATQLVALCREGKFVDAIETLYAHHVVSVEAMDYQGMGREMHGKEAVKGKNVGWFENNDVHSVSVTGPFVSPERFAVLYSFDWTSKASGERVQLNEVAVYTVVDGKIAHEEFLYSAGQ
ncbi:MAG: nuclear transport factor 2 family protein [Acidobacteriia bacterium]|nr:nuclear transport factor 2 family protein [Terriglobia bacterium]